MYLASNVNITFPAHRGRQAFKFLSCSSFRTDCSWQHLTDTAEFIVSKALYFESKGRVFELVKPGDPFFIEAGYNGQMNREFTGFVSEILDDLPVVFKAEDNMYLLKRTFVNKSFANVSLANLLKAIVPSQFKIDAADVMVGDFICKQWTVAMVLQELKDKLGLYSYFVGDTLVSGKIYIDNPQKQTVKYQFNKNIIANDLKYRREDDYQIKVTMRSYLHDGKVLKVSEGDPEGTEMKLVVSNVKDKEALRTLARKELARLKYDGYRGTLTSFGLPYVQHGYTANIVNLQNSDRNGDYYVDRVVTEFYNQGAIRRIVTIGRKAA